MEEFKLAAVKIEHRETAAVEAQKVLTEFGCSIKVRLGLHDMPDNACSPVGLLILKLVDTDANIEAFMSKLNGIDGVTAKSLTI